MLISDLEITAQSGGYLLEMAETRLLPVFDDKNFISSGLGGIYDGREYISRVGNLAYHPNVNTKYDIADWMVDKSLTNPVGDFNYTSNRVHRVPVRFLSYVTENNLWRQTYGSTYYKDYHWDKQVDLVHGLSSDPASNTMAFHYPRADIAGDTSVGIVNLKTGGLINDINLRYYVNKDAAPGRIANVNSTGIGGWSFLNPDNTLKIFLDDGTIIPSTSFSNRLPDIIPIKGSPLIWQTALGQNWCVCTGAGASINLATKSGNLDTPTDWIGEDGSMPFPGGCSKVLKIIPPRVIHIDQPIDTSNPQFFIVYVDTGRRIRVGTVLNANSGTGTMSIVDVTTSDDVDAGSVYNGNMKAAVSGFFYAHDYLYISFTHFGVSRRHETTSGATPGPITSTGSRVVMIRISLSSPTSTPCQFLRMDAYNWQVTKAAPYIESGHTNGDAESRGRYFDVVSSIDFSFVGVGGAYAGLRVKTPLYSREFLRLGFGAGRTITALETPDPIPHYGGIPPGDLEYTDGYYFDNHTIVTYAGKPVTFSVVAQGVSSIDNIASIEITTEFLRALDGVTTAVGLANNLSSLFVGVKPSTVDVSVGRNVLAFPIPTSLSDAFKEFGGLVGLKENPSIFESNPTDWANEVNPNITDFNYLDFSIVLADAYGNISAGVISRTPADTQYSELVYSGAMGSDGAVSDFGSMLNMPNVGSYHVRVK